jgi:hypothetical protein
MCNATAASIVAAAFLACGSSAAAQDASRFAVEIRGGNGIPTGEWTEDGDTENGSGFGLNGQFQLAPFASVYAGWERYSFDVVRSGNLEFMGGHTSDSEARLGIQVTLPLSAVARPFVLGGLTYSRVETGTSSLKSAGAMGYEAGAGVDVPIIPPLSLTPGARYRSHRAKFQRSVAIEEERQTTISYWSWEIGLKLGL